MTKRTFRQRPMQQPRYPTLEQFDADRRGFLGQLGAGLLGLLVMGSKTNKPDKPPAKKPPTSKKKRPPSKKKRAGKKHKKKRGKRNKPKPPPDALLGLLLEGGARIDEV